MDQVAPTIIPEPEEQRHVIRRRLFKTFLTLLVLSIATTGFVLYSQGYRISFNSNTPIIAHTGILNTSSSPRGAQVYVNDHLTTATNNTVNLAPGKYSIRMSKDGYRDWLKDVEIKEQLVTNADALLFPVAPTLQSISAIGISNPVMDPSATKLAFTIASQSAQKNGIYVLDMTARSFPVLLLQSSSNQIANDIPDTFSQAQLTWSPDGQQLLASIAGELASTTYLLQANTMNTNPQDVTATLPNVQATWKTQEDQKNKARLAALKPAAKDLLKNFSIISWSPDEMKILYEAKEDANLPVVIRPRRIGNNLLYETRKINKGSIYVYNITEDVNTKILDNSPVGCDVTLATCETHLTWFPDSDHLVYVNDQKINIVDTDGANMTTIYAGPFEDHYAFPWPDGSKIVIVTNLNNTSTPPTLYTISLE